MINLKLIQPSFFVSSCFSRSIGTPALSHSKNTSQHEKSSAYAVQICKFVFLPVLMSVFVGCAGKEPNLKEVYIPVKCPLKMPQKPQNNGDFQSHKEMMIYYLECENIALQCVGEK